MNDENTAQGPLSIMDGAQKLRQSREAAQQAPEEENQEPVVEQAEDQADVETEAVADTEAEAPEVEEDQPEAETEDEAGLQTDEIYEVEGIEFTAAELKEMKEGALRQADYTRKTQEVAKEKADLAAQKQQFESERQQVQQQFQQQHAQLQDALATFAIEQDPAPKVADFPSWDEFAKAQETWESRSQQRQQAQQVYQALQAEQHQQTVQREFSALLSKKPEFADQAVFAQAMETMGQTAQRYGYSPEEFAAISDHRIFLALADLQAADTSKAKAAATEKKVVQATKRLTPSAKQKPTSAAQKRVREAKARFDKNPNMQNGAALRKAQREAAAT